jgi:hypothetical protein
VKNDRNIFRLQCEPRSCASHEDHHTRLIEYDDRMRQEEKKYSRLLMELNKSCSFAQSGPYKGSEQSGFAKHAAVDQTMDEGQSSELEVTRLTGDEILYGGGLTMEQVLLNKKKPSALHVDGRIDRTGTHHAMAFHDNLSPQERNDDRSARIEMNQAASRDALEWSGRESLPWESVMVESVGLVLQRWRGVCSFSLSALCNRNKDDIDVTYHLSSEKQCRTACPNSVRRGE